MVNIIQHGSDGFGHQLYGLFSCLLLHGIRNYYFDGIVFINKKFHFDHLNNNEQKLCKNYLTKVVSLFNKANNINKKRYNGYIHSHEIYKIPTNYKENVIYGLDNVYYFDRINLNNHERIHHTNNINKINPFFLNDELPKNRLDSNNVVIHIRQGDALTTGRGESISSYNKKVMNLLDIFFKKYSNFTYYLHSDGDVTIFENTFKKNNIKYYIYNKNTPILQVVSDFMYSKIFICGNSGLSKACSFINNKELIIINDDNKHSLPEKTIKISEFIRIQYEK